MNHLAHSEMAVVFNDTLSGSQVFEDIFNTIHKLFLDTGCNLPEILSATEDPIPNEIYCESIAVNKTWLTVYPMSFDERGRKVEESEEEFGADDERQVELFNVVKDMFTPSIFPELQSVWSKVWEIQVSPKEVRFHVMPDTPIEKVKG